MRSFRNGAIAVLGVTENIEYVFSLCLKIESTPALSGEHRAWRWLPAKGGCGDVLFLEQ